MQFKPFLSRLSMKQAYPLTKFREFCDPPRLFHPPRLFDTLEYTHVS